ncbi:MAG: hypothetical protein AAFM92_03250 [Pseudomonadota bacterium]
MDLKRLIDPTLLTALAGEEIYPIALVFIDWPTGPVRAHTNTGTVAFEGEDFAGVGELGRIEIPDEATSLVPESAVIALASETTGLLTYADEDQARGSEVRMWVGLTTTPGGTTLKGVPEEVFTGSVVGSSFQLSEGRRIASLSIEVKAGQPARAGAQVVHSDEDQQALFPGDTFFQRIANAEKWNTTPDRWPE